MGKRLIQQRAGRGTSRYRCRSHRYKGEFKYPLMNNKNIEGIVIDIVHCSGHTAPLARVKFDNGEKVLLGAFDGMHVGKKILYGNNIEIKPGNITRLGEIPIGTEIYNIEKTPGDGGKFIKSAGVFGKIIHKLENSVVIVLPSKKHKEFNIGCRAMIGILAGGGRVNKPFVKAGKKWHAMRARGGLYPRTSAVAMNPCNHPFGSGRGRHPGKSTTAPRNAPPGRKVGLIRPRRTGRRR
ncbi:MAG TPA: 50S ribosomal protein L2 [Candidatus Nanoarchaeia archaeon]|nr:50S ribosomal protein L2 [Candidatus Nanoarchaeia archaeon]